MKSAGPSLQHLTHRLAETPAPFLAEPRIGASGIVSVPALVHDLLLMHGRRTDGAHLTPFAGSTARADRNRLALTMIAVWMLADEWFTARPMDADTMLIMLARSLDDIAAASPAHEFVQEPDRREELARHLLAQLGYRPEGETERQAIDRLSSVSGAQRKRLLEQSRAAEQRAREIRAALAKKAAEESADKWTRE